MLPNDRTRAFQDIATQREAPEGIGAVVNTALGFLKRQYLLILFVAALAVGASVIYVRITQPTYTARVKVLLENPRAPFLQQQSILAERPIDGPQLESQIEILRSKTIATSVIDSLRLADDQDFKSSSQPVYNTIRELLAYVLPDRKPDQTDRLVAEFGKRLSAERVGYSTVIEIGFAASSAERAAEIANAIASAYITSLLNAKVDASRTATNWLRLRLKELGNDALIAERAVNALKVQNNIVAASGKLMDEEQVAELNSRLVAVRTQTSEAAARTVRYETIVASDSANKESISGLDALGTDVNNNPGLNTLRQQYYEYARRESEYSTRYGKNHEAVVNLRVAMRSIRTSILDELRRLAETSRNEFELAKQRQREIEKQLAVAVSQSQNKNSAEMSIRELETSAKGYRALYESFLQRFMASVQQESFPISEAQVISPASPGLTQTKSRTGVVLLLGLVAGIALGIGLGLLREILDGAFRTSQQIEAALRLPCLSLVPRLQAAKRNELSPPATAQLDKESGQRTLFGTSGTYWAATAMPLSPFAESIRSIRVAIDLDSSNKVIGVTSTLPDEGKSTIAASLGQLLARAGRRVVIVDCDLRNPSLSANLAPDASVGLLEVLAGARPLEETIWSDPRTNLAFLPVAKKGAITHTSEILSAEQTKKLFDKLRATYDYVIVDLPPLAPIVDVRVTTALIDCFVLVVEWGRTNTDVVQHALHAAPNVYEAVVGAVLNKTDMNAMRRYANRYGDYYNEKHYVHYGNQQAE
jgi:exopolysaccharide transport family protein